MRLSVLRFASTDQATLGGLHIDGQFASFVLEDQRQERKITDETRIPAGLYQIALRTAGGMNEKYAARFTNHKGMLWLQDVPGFEWVYIHVGNSDNDTSGCLLVGDTATVDMTLGGSATAYRRVYAKVSNAILAGEAVEILVEDAD